MYQKTAEVMESNDEYGYKALARNFTIRGGVLSLTFFVTRLSEEQRISDDAHKQLAQETGTRSTDSCDAALRTETSSNIYLATRYAHLAAQDVADLSEARHCRHERPPVNPQGHEKASKWITVARQISKGNIAVRTRYSPNVATLRTCVYSFACSRSMPCCPANRDHDRDHNHEKQKKPPYNVAGLVTTFVARLIGQLCP
jgi:hypothetical protein